MHENDSNTAVRVLLVEDDRASSEPLHLLLRRRGHHVTTARTVAEARREVEKLPDWVVLDLLLPDGNGVQILEMIHDRSLPVRVAILTGINDPIRLWEATRLHPDAFMRKPVDPYNLVKAIEFES